MAKHRSDDPSTGEKLEEAGRQFDPPPYGAAARQAVSAVVDGVVAEMSNRIAELRRKIDTMEQSMLANATAVKASLETHIAMCGNVGDEIGRISTLVDDMQRQQDDSAAAIINAANTRPRLTNGAGAQA
jgi:uncharacterized protein YaaN involved in tellurite resistance